jgi:hypothetical protein
MGSARRRAPDKTKMRNRPMGGKALGAGHGCKLLIVPITRIHESKSRRRHRLAISRVAFSLLLLRLFRRPSAA